LGALSKNVDGAGGMQLADIERMLTMGWGQLLKALLAACTLAACSGENVTQVVAQPERVRDLNGDVYGFRCDEHGYSCRGELLEESPPPPTCSEGWHPSAVWTAGSTRFFPLHVTCASNESGTWLIDLFESRYLVCETAADCPSLITSSSEYRFECERGVCQNTDEKRYPRDQLSPSEVSVFCLAGTPRRPSYELSDEEYAAFSKQIEEYCPEAGPDCRVPPECGFEF
jgi:hypothetical protein